MSRSRATNKLTALKVKNLKFAADGKNKHVDGDGLYLLVQENGSKYWRFDYTRPIVKKRNTLALGVYPAVSLEQARVELAKARELLRQDIDPAEHREEVRQNRKSELENSFEKIARQWLAIRELEEKDDRENLRMLEKDVFPYIGSKAINTITTDLLEREVTDRFIERGSLVAAKKVRVPIKGIFAFAKKKKLVGSNPANDMTLPTPRKGNFAAITSPTELSHLIKAIWEPDQIQALDVCTVQAMKLSALIFLRPTEIRSMQWSSYNRADKILEVVPLKQRKNVEQKTLIVPLAKQAMEILDEIYQFTGHTEYVFYSRRGKEPYLSEGTVNMAIKRLGFSGKQTAHGFRATARTILEERLDMPSTWIEQQLAHTVKDPNGTAYNRTKFVDQRHDMMQKWADYLDELRASV